LLTGAFSAFIDDISIHQKSASSPTEDVSAGAVVHPLQIAPKPVQSSNLRISLEDVDPAFKTRIQIFDATGLLKGAYDLSGTDLLDIPTENWPAGIYFATMAYNGRILTRKIVKMH
jgi:hypothetical protein